MSWDKLKVILGVITSIIFLVGIIVAVESYFAKNKDVETVVEKLEKNDELIQQRVDISIIDDQIFQQEQQIYRIKDLTSIERIEKPMTPVEKEILDKNKKRLEELKQRREKKIERYEQK